MTVHVRRCDTWVSKHSGDALPGVEVKDADVFVGAAGGHILTRRIELNLPGRKKRESRSDALIIYCRWGEKACGVCRKTLPWADCRPHSGTPCRVSSVCRCWCWKSWESQTGKKRIESSKCLSATTHGPFRNTHTFPRAHLMQRSWQPTAAYLQVGSTPMSYRVVLLTMWWERRNSVPLSVCETNKKLYLVFIYLFKRITIIWIQLVPTKASRSYLQHTS